MFVVSLQREGWVNLKRPALIPVRLPLAWLFYLHDFIFLAVVGAFSSSTNSLAASVSSNFSAANFSAANFSAANFSAANFSAANFSAANFSAANFSAVIRSERRMLLPNSSLVVALLTTAPPRFAYLKQYTGTAHRVERGGTQHAVGEG